MPSASPDSSASSSRRRHFGFQRLQGRFGLGDDTGVVLGFAEFDQADIVLDLIVDAAERGERILKRGPLLHQPAGPLRVVP